MHKKIQCAEEELFNHTVITFKHESITFSLLFKQGTERPIALEAHLTDMTDPDFKLTMREASLRNAKVSKIRASLHIVPTACQLQS